MIFELMELVNSHCYLTKLVEMQDDQPTPFIFPCLSLRQTFDTVLGIEMCPGSRCR
jgi:hypothetical protein